VHTCEDLIRVFNALFLNTEATELEGGGVEPIYQPSTGAGRAHKIVFTSDYFSSGLHEVAHWCLAGKERRKQIDFGYWYNPDGRTAVQQQEFERVEVKPQAIEWFFSKSVGIKFRVSADNLQNDLGASVAFKRAVYTQTLAYIQNGLPTRAARFSEALREFYRKAPLSNENFSYSDL